MDAARGVLQRRVRACISRPGVLSGRVIYPSLWLSSSLSSLSSSVRARSSPRTTVSPLRGGALREGRGLLTPVMAGAGVGYSTTTGASGEQEQEQEKAQEQEQEQEPEKAQEQEQEQEPEKAQEQELEQGQEPEKPQVQISQGEDAEQVQGGLERLLENGWVLDGERMGIKKTFYFRSYFKAVVGFVLTVVLRERSREADWLVQSFLNVVASQSATKKHHPTMTVRIGSVDVHWTTHNPRGLSSKDIAMAEHCEEGAQLMGAVDEAKGKKCSLPAVTLLGTPTREREHEA
ncbi:hypothetical protein KXW98_002308 [Aspergillus fumigatus]|uniref:4a-hydroxytetrahydrobiopterin dehydratase n=2 Tax=Aspergillus fumigatus TaxID=746128 RepID=B0XSY4_ASPFC|nr:pterin-4-alpha-carbinolamine dehydratase family protein [Aspergillus fumigatus A1163]KAF4257408.1 hypothetical protein CNMCM8812_006756 [Aspergillus fumigatus]KAF4271239.1 hypothetical protein CNMCM8057_007290 [Aspergillus fumigatus]KAF4287229.1 hypothetical protein CNMCM8689_000720 [Aspergillus fumigatus]KAF4293582.1 hypothetical protein CNMCM8686_005732 [Aspergillus fumigatus]